MIALLLEVVALKGAMVHTLVDGAPAQVATVLVENDTIVAVGPDIAPPEGARIVDLTGLHLVPGLIDAFVNHDPDHDALYVASGVTLVRDTGNDLARMEGERERAARDRVPGPWIHGCGGMIDGAPPLSNSSVVCVDEAAVEEKLPRLAEMGFEEFVVSPGLPIASWKRAISWAHQHERKVWGPLLARSTLVEALEAGQDGFHHLDVLMESKSGWDKALEPDLVRNAERVASAKRAIVPTLAVWARRLLPPKEGTPELKFVSPYYVQTWLADLEARRAFFQKDESRLPKGLEVVAMQGRLAKLMDEKGAVVLPGSGAPNAWLLPGYSLHDELSLMKRAGIPSARILRLATAEAARAIGQTRRGTIEKGRIADLLALKEDPELDIGALRSPEHVVLRGRVLSRAELDANVDKLVARMQTLREEFTKPIEVPDVEWPGGDAVMHGRVETRAVGERVSGERFVVTRKFDGALVYAGRLVVPGSATVAAMDTAVSQTIHNGEVVSFKVAMKSGGKELVVRGENTGGRTNVERRLDGLLLDTTTIEDRIALVDCGSVTAHLVMGFHRNPGSFKVLWFEGFDPAIGKWEMRLDKDPRTHLVRTHDGEMVAAFNDDGSLKEALRVRVAGRVQTKPLETKIDDGRGLPMSPQKRAMAPKPAEASAPSDDKQKGAKPAPGGANPPGGGGGG